MEVRLREATAADVPGLQIVRRQAIEHGLVGEYDRRNVAPIVAADDGDLAARVGSDQTLVVVAESDVTVFGFGVCDRAVGRVRGLFTAPEYQREGWGTRILGRLEAAARQAGHETLDARVPRNARDFFRTNGFVEVGEAERDGLAVLQMQKPLD